MKQKRYNGLKLCVALPLAMIIACTPIASAFGQAESQLENMKQVFGPDLWNESGIRFGLLELDWQLKQREALLARLDRNCQMLEDELRERRAVQDALNSRKPADYRLATEQVRGELTGRCLEKLLDARLDIAANRAVLEELEKQAEEKGTARNPISEVTKAKLQNLAQQRELTLGSLERMKRLVEQGDAPTGGLADIEIQLSKIEGETMILKAEHETVEQSARNNQSRQLVDLELETKKLTAFEKAATNELEKLGEAEKIERQIAEIEVQVHAAMTLQEAIAEKLASLHIEIEELESLRSLINAAIKEQDSSKQNEPKSEEAKESVFEE